MTVASFPGVRVAGGLLPADVLSRLVIGRGVEGLSTADFHLGAGESVREAANRSWAYLSGSWVSFRSALALLPESDRATSLTRERVRIGKVYILRHALCLYLDQRPVPVR